MTKTGPTPLDTPVSGGLDQPITPVTPALPVLPVPPRDRSTARLRLVSIVAALVLAVVGGTALLMWPRGNETFVPPGEGALGAAPDRTSATVGSAPTGVATAAAPAPSASPSTDAATGIPPVSSSPEPVPTVQNGSFVVTSRSTGGPLVGTSIEITVRNVGGGPADWHSVTLEIAGINLVVTSSDKSILYSPQGGAHCLVPADGKQTLNAGGSTTFTVTVTNLLGGRGQATALDTPPCPS